MGGVAMSSLPAERDRTVGSCVSELAIRARFSRSFDFDANDRHNNPRPNAITDRYSIATADKRFHTTSNDSSKCRWTR